LFAQRLNVGRVIVCCPLYKLSVARLIHCY
jgi:hypothetical protein